MGTLGAALERFGTRRVVRERAAAVAASIAVVYLLIGAGVARISSIEPAGMDLLAFGFASGAAFLVLAALLLTSDRRWLWTTAFVFTLVTIVMYVVVAPTRIPMYEPWGLAQKVMQAVLLVGLGRLLLRPTRGGAVPI